MTQPTLQYHSPSPAPAPPPRYWTSVLLLSAATAISSAGIPALYLWLFGKMTPGSAIEIAVLAIAMPTSLGAIILYMFTLFLQRRFSNRVPHPNLLRPVIAGLLGGISIPTFILLILTFQSAWFGRIIFCLVIISIVLASFLLTKNDDE